MKSATCQLAQLGVQLLGGADLLHAPRAQHHQAVGERQRLLLVVRDVDGGQPERLVQAADLGAHLQPQLRVEVGQRLVHEHQRRLEHHRPGDGHPLLLPAGELAGQLAGLVLQVHQAQRLVDPAADLRAGYPAHLEAERDVAADRQVREERVVLEHHAEAAPLRRQHVEPRLVLPDAAAGQRQQPGQAVQRRRLAAAGRAEQGDELAPLDRQVQPGERLVAAEAAADPVQPQGVELSDHLDTFAPPISRSHLSNAATRSFEPSGTSSGLPAISAVYSG
nr:hypothetical protein GCM10020092_048220 [Actinoplanes digitatis]